MTLLTELLRKSTSMLTEGSIIWPTISLMVFIRNGLLLFNLSDYHKVQKIVYLLKKQVSNSTLANYFVSGDRGKTLEPSTEEIRDGLTAITHSNNTMYAYKELYYNETFGNDFKIYPIKP